VTFRLTKTDPYGRSTDVVRIIAQDDPVCQASVMRNDLPLTVIANLVDDPELRFTPAGVPVARFTVASTPPTFDRAANAWQDGEPTFLDCSAWRQLAENLTESLAKGARVVVAGRLRTDRWETPEGEKRSRPGTGRPPSRPPSSPLSTGSVADGGELPYRLRPGGTSEATGAGVSGTYIS
jgi:hypothetical protein